MYKRQVPVRGNFHDAKALLAGLGVGALDGVLALSLIHIWCALRHAAELLSGIERGACEASPARLETSDPCRYCDSRLACG